MAFNANEIKQMEKVVAAHLEEHRPPVHLRDELDLGFRVEKQSVTIFEIRPHWDRPEEKIEVPLAKARYLKLRDQWMIYWMRSNARWQPYAPVPAVGNLREFLAVVAADKHHCFFG